MSTPKTNTEFSNVERKLIKVIFYFYMTYGQLSAVSHKTHRTGHRLMMRNHGRPLRKAKYEDLCHTLRAGKYELATRDRWQLQ
jgi:hypothetical protein